MRLYFSFSPAAGFVFLVDDSRGLPAADVVSPVAAVRADHVSSVFSETTSPPVGGPMLLSTVRKPVAADYVPNRLKVNCKRCGRPIAKGTGYRQYLSGGFYCEQCQCDQNQPMREKLPALAE